VREKELLNMDESDDDED